MWGKIAAGLFGGVWLALAASTWASLYLPAQGEERWFVAGLIVLPLALGGMAGFMVEDARQSWLGLGSSSVIAVLAMTYHFMPHPV